MTVHKSKGDEFDNVILLWDVAKEILESLTIDNNNNIDYSINGLTDIVKSTTYVFRTRDTSAVDLIDEELRVLYVALTRAKKNLWVVLANTPPKNASDKKLEKLNNKLSAYSEILKLKK
jgi:ATP-dependent exoDNAse (exonuclease V) beta subunit